MAVEPWILTPQGPAQARHVRIVVNADGLAALVWWQLMPNESSPGFIDVRLGSVATGAWGALESAYTTGSALTTLSAGGHPPAAALAADGTLTVASETAAYPFLGVAARTRTPAGGGARCRR